MSSASDDEIDLKNTEDEGDSEKGNKSQFCDDIGHIFYPVHDQEAMNVMYHYLNVESTYDPSKWVFIKQPKRFIYGKPLCEYRRPFVFEIVPN